MFSECGQMTLFMYSRLRGCSVCICVYIGAKPTYSRCWILLKCSNIQQLTYSNLWNLWHSVFMLSLVTNSQEFNFPYHQSVEKAFYYFIKFKNLCLSSPKSSKDFGGANLGWTLSTRSTKDSKVGKTTKNSGSNQFDTLCHF